MQCPECGGNARAYLSNMDDNPVAAAAGSGPVRVECVNCGDSLIPQPEMDIMWEAFTDSVRDEQEKQHYRVAATLARVKYIKDSTGVDYPVGTLVEVMESFDIGISTILASDMMGFDEFTSTLVAVMSHEKYISEATMAHRAVCRIVAQFRREEVPESCLQDQLEGEE